MEKTSMKGKRGAIASIATIPLIMTLGNSMLIPVLPAMEKHLKISKLQSSYIITVYSLVAIFLIPIAGFLSDKFGRKAVIIPSLIITAIGGTISGFAAWKFDAAFGWIMFGRVLQGIGAAGAFPIVLPLVSDLCEEDEQRSVALGLIETSNTFGKVLSPILGSLIASIVWFLPFFSIPVFCFIALLLLIFFVKKPKKDENDFSIANYVKQIKEIFKQHWKWLIAIFLIGAIIMFVLFGLLFYLSSMLEDKHNMEGVKKGLLLAIPLAGLCISSFAAGKLIKDRLKLMKWIAFSGLVIAGGSVLATIISEKMLFLIFILFICGVGIGASLPCLDAILTQTIDEQMQGTITAFFSSMRFVGVASGPPAVALLMKGKTLDMAIVLAACSALGALLAFFAIKPGKERQEKTVS